MHYGEGAHALVTSVTAALPKHQGSCVLPQKNVGSDRASVDSHVSLSLWPPGTLYHAAVHEKLFTTKLGDSYKCASEQTFCSEKNFQLLFVHMQLQAFDIVGDQFGKGKQKRILCHPSEIAVSAFW